MRLQQFETLCSDLRAGDTLFVENLDLCYKGKVLACGSDSLEVDALGHRFDWPRERCRPARGVNPLGPTSSY